MALRAGIPVRGPEQPGLLPPHRLLGLLYRRGEDEIPGHGLRRHGAHHLQHLPAPGNGFTFDGSVSPPTLTSSNDTAKAATVRFTLTATDANNNTAAAKVSVTVIDDVCSKEHGWRSKQHYVPSHLIYDCNVLLSGKEMLEGSGGKTLDWSVNKPIFNFDGPANCDCDGWEGVGPYPGRGRVGTLVWPDSDSLPQPSSAPRLAGSIPPQFGALHSLATISFQDHNLTGPVPPELASAQMKLGTISFAGNNLTGSIPKELAKHLNLVNLYLNDNNLSGSIPPEFGNAPNLAILNLRDNAGLTGGIPAELGDNSKLRAILLDNTGLGGSIPTELGNLTKLKYLYLANAGLTGSIPDELGNIAALQYLSLDGNSLSGSIPTELGRLTKLEHLFLNGNSLNGSIPEELGNLTNLKYLYLNNAGLSGSIPAELGSLTKLEGLRLNDNQLTGSIPTELGNLTALENLWLHNNALTGAIPSTLAALGELKYFSGESSDPAIQLPVQLHGNSLDDTPVTLNVSPAGRTMAEDGGAVTYTVTASVTDAGIQWAAKQRVSGSYTIQDDDPPFSNPDCHPFRLPKCTVSATWNGEHRHGVDRQADRNRERRGRRRSRRRISGGTYPEHTLRLDHQRILPVCNYSYGQPRSQHRRDRNLHRNRKGRAPSGGHLRGSKPGGDYHPKYGTARNPYAHADANSFADSYADAAPDAYSYADAHTTTAIAQRGRPALTSYLDADTHADAGAYVGARAYTGAYVGARAHASPNGDARARASPNGEALADPYTHANTNGDDADTHTGAYTQANGDAHAHICA